MSVNVEDLERIDRGKRTRRPTHPGTILEKEFLEPQDITQTELADHLGCDNKTIHRIVTGKTRMTPAMAQKLASAFETTAEFWLNLQQAVDLHEVRQETEEPPGPIRAEDDEQKGVARA